MTLNLYLSRWGTINPSSVNLLPCERYHEGAAYIPVHEVKRPNGLTLEWNGIPPGKRETTSASQ